MFKLLLIVSFDLNAHGMSSGEYLTWGAKEKYDLLNVVSFLEKKAGIPRNKIGLIGASLGGAISLQAATIDKRLAFVLSDSAFSDIPTIVKERGNFLFGKIVNYFYQGALYLSSLRADFSPWAWNPVQVAKHISTPVLLVHSSSDAYTRVDHAKRIYKNLDKKKSKLFITNWGSKHVKSIDENYKEYKSVFDKFLNNHVGPFGL